MLINSSGPDESPSRARYLYTADCGGGQGQWLTELTHSEKCAIISQDYGSSPWTGTGLTGCVHVCEVVCGRPKGRSGKGR